jgi:hypothetical protein
VAQRRRVSEVEAAAARAGQQAAAKLAEAAAELAAARAEWKKEKAALQEATQDESERVSNEAAEALCKAGMEQRARHAAELEGVREAEVVLRRRVAEAEATAAVAGQQAAAKLAEAAEGLGSAHAEWMKEKAALQVG